MTNEQKEKLRKIFIEKKAVAKRMLNLTKEIDSLNEEIFGFVYSDFDFEGAIDTLDYGTSDISFKEYIEGMNEIKRKIDSGYSFGGSLGSTHVVINEIKNNNE